MITDKLLEMQEYAVKTYCFRRAYMAEARREPKPGPSQYCSW